MMRVLLVDDSASTRELISQRLAERGYEVTGASDPLVAAEMAMNSPPDFVVTDLWMPGVSGVQLCRLLRSEPRTAHVPVILITSESHRRSRFWAKTAGAAAYVAKEDLHSLYATLERLAAESPPVALEPTRPASRTPMHHRLFQRLDAALFESVVAGEVRALAHDEGEAESVFRGLARLCSEVTAYRWLAVHVHSPPRLFIHVQRSERLAAEVEVRAALDVPADVDVSVICDDRPVTGRASTPITAEVRGAAKVMGTIALGPNPRGASRDDRDLVSMVAAELGGPLRIVALVEQSRRLAMSDPLTGLLNRRAFTDLMTRSLASLERYGEPVSLLLLDVDHFKQVNDAHGHDAGDAVLITIADVLRRLARETDFVARWGGEEFVVGLAHTGIPASLTPAERVRRAIIEQPFALPGGGEISVTSSIGIASAMPGERLDTLVARADQAMYLAKARGRNRCELHDGRSSMQLRAASPVTAPPVELKTSVSTGH